MKHLPEIHRARIAIGDGIVFFITLTFSELAPIAAQENMSCYRFKTPPGFEPINQSPTLNMDKEVFDDFEDLIKENYTIYGDDSLNEPYYNIIKPLMKKLYNRLLDDVENKNYTSPVFKHHLNDRVLGNSYREKNSRKIIADSNDIVVDFIASMTDDYFVDICKHLHIDDTLTDSIKYYEYF